MGYSSAGQKTALTFLSLVAGIAVAAFVGFSIFFAFTLQSAISDYPLEKYGAESFLISPLGKASAASGRHAYDVAMQGERFVVEALLEGGRWTICGDDRQLGKSPMPFSSKSCRRRKSLKAPS